MPLALLFLSGCHRNGPTDLTSLHDDAQRKFRRGDFNAALAETNEGLSRHGGSDSTDAWRLRLLKTEILLWQGQNREAVLLLSNQIPANGVPNDLRARRMALLGQAESNLDLLSKADQDFEQAEQLNKPRTPTTSCTILLGKGKVAAMKGQFVDAERNFREALLISRSSGLSLSQASALGNLGMLNMRERRYADAVDWLNASLALAGSEKASASTAHTYGNLGWAYLEMGDLERAEDKFDQASKKAQENSIRGVAQTSLMELAEVQLLQGKLLDAQATYERSLALARALERRQEIIYGLNNLARVAILEGNFDTARFRLREATTLEGAAGDQESMLYSDLYEAQIRVASHQLEAAKGSIDKILSGRDVEATLRAEALNSLAGIQEQEGRFEAAEHSYENGAKLLDTAQQSVGRTDYQLSYPIFAKGIYGDYIHFLIRHVSEDKALHLIEQHKAQTLTAGIRSTALPVASRREQSLAQAGHIILSYWLGKGTSYVWAIGPDGTHMAPLPDQDQIAAAVKRYQSRLTSSFGTEDSGAGQALYRMLVEPVKQWIPPAASITIIPDGALCSLNFETLVVPAPRPHYWIEDVAVHEASSLSLLEHGSRAPAKKAGVTPVLLLVGDPKTPVSYPELSHAHAEVDAVAKHFPREQEAVLTGAAATPTAYFAAKPEDYDVIHFVAHGTASRLSPLDSAVVLSDDGKSYNLFARQIMEHPLHARLVTISSCDSAGGRIYSAEGLVGMSWAFLRAGAHQVVAALWQVNDASTPRFMDAFYTEVAQGRDPADALRDAKLAMLHSGTIYAKPFYWAPFVLYEGH